MNTFNVAAEVEAAKAAEDAGFEVAFAEVLALSGPFGIAHGSVELLRRQMRVIYSSGFIEGGEHMAAALTAAIAVKPPVKP